MKACHQEGGYNHDKQTMLGSSFTYLGELVAARKQMGLFQEKSGKLLL